MSAVTDAETLFAKYHDRVFRYLYRASGQADTAQDLTQDVFLRVSRTAAPRGAEGQVAAWLFKIARNIVVDHLRQCQRRPELTATVDQASGPASQEVVVAVNQALGRLAELDRDVFLMREMSGLGYQEIATVCDLTPDAVRNRIHRARLALRDALAGPVETRRSGSLRLSCHTGQHDDEHT
jgi:RNA polymerase sigma-70 factor (ECF subfamily)